MPDSTIGQLLRPHDLTNYYNTSLSPVQEAAFQKWAQENGRIGDLYDYDMRGAWLAQAKQAGNGHFPDTYKKPNHPTFSNESQYSNVGIRGGDWSGDTFYPSQQNTQTSGILGLLRYMGAVEPGSQLGFGKRK